MNEELPKECCSNCRFVQDGVGLKFTPYFDIKGTTFDFGEKIEECNMLYCHRYPKKVRVNEDYWCGEYREGY